MYYIDKNNELFYEPSDEVIKQYELKEITQEKFNIIIASKNKIDVKAEEIAKAKWYLRDTDWIKSYELEHKLGITIIPEDSSKWEIINKRNEYISFLNNIDSN